MREDNVNEPHWVYLCHFRNRDNVTALFMGETEQKLKILHLFFTTLQDNWPKGVHTAHRFSNAPVHNTAREVSVVVTIGSMHLHT